MTDSADGLLDQWLDRRGTPAADTLAQQRAEEAGAEETAAESGQGDESDQPRADSHDQSAPLDSLVGISDELSRLASDPSRRFAGTDPASAVIAAFAALDHAPAADPRPVDEAAAGSASDLALDSDSDSDHPESMPRAVSGTHADPEATAEMVEEGSPIIFGRLLASEEPEIPTASARSTASAEPVADTASEDSSGAASAEPVAASTPDDSPEAASAPTSSTTSPTDTTTTDSAAAVPSPEAAATQAPDDAGGERSVDAILSSLDLPGLSASTEALLASLTGARPAAPVAPAASASSAPAVPSAPATPVAASAAPAAEPPQTLPTEAGELPPAAEHDADDAHPTVDHDTDHGLEAEAEAEVDDLPPSPEPAPSPTGEGTLEEPAGAGRHADVRVDLKEPDERDAPANRVQMVIEANAPAHDDRRSPAEIATSLGGIPVDETGEEALRPQAVPALSATDPALPYEFAFAPRRTGHRVLALVLAVGILVTIACCWWAFSSRSLTAIGIAAVVGVATAIIWAARAGDVVTRLAMTGSRLTIERAGTRSQFDLADPHTPVSVEGQPGESGWQVTFTRRSMSPVVIDSSMVDPAEFMRVFDTHRPQH